MGEVYKAKDTRLDRLVAVKVLSERHALDDTRRARFEREARAISSLNHPHICTVHDVGRDAGIDYLVMEYVHGETLAERLRKGALPPAEAIKHATQIGDALDKAHRAGVVHRDLKPSNVMLTKAGAKLLDFGLAKLRPPDARGPHSVATEEALTETGALLGTVPYMAPEQLEGKEADERTDIFALGTMLYEMLTGRPAFTGQSQAGLIAAILDSNPHPISAVKPLTPPALDRIVAVCLAKDPDERWQSARDVVLALQSIGDGASQAAPLVPVAIGSVTRQRLAWTAAAIAIALLGVVGALSLMPGRPPEQPRQVQLQVLTPDNMTFAFQPAISPDGDRVAFAAYFELTTQLYVRPLSAVAATPISGAHGSQPFWSPDGRELAYWSLDRLEKVDLSSGARQTLCRLPGVLLGASWNRNGVIVFSADGKLFRVASSGGEPTPLGTPADGELGRFWPYFLPDGRHYLYLSRSSRADDRGVYVASIDSGDRKRVILSNHNAAYASGHLLFVRGDALVAQPFDLETFDLRGDAFPIAERIAPVRSPEPGLAYSVSGNGVLAWEPAASHIVQLTWFHRSGRKLSTLGEPAPYWSPALAPDETRLAVSHRDEQTGTRDLWLFDLPSGGRRRLTFDPADDVNPTWSPDGSRIAFASNRTGTHEIYLKLSNGAGGDELLKASPDGPNYVEDWSSDGAFLVYNHQPRGPSDIYLLPLLGNRTPIPVTATRVGDDMGQVTRSGRWMAYRSQESGRSEVYVRGVSLDGTSDAGKWQVSTEGGLEPRWRGDGRELFYMSGPTLMAVEVKSAAQSFEAGTPTPLFEARLPFAGGRNRYVVTRDGQRFLFAVLTEQSHQPIRVTVNALPAR
jgi:Tol biopolymer transport system component